jgi:gluconolactonase
MQLSIEDVSVYADGLDHAECVVVHPDGSLWAGGEGGQIYHITSEGSKIEEVNNTEGFILGLAFSPDASWLAICDSKNRCLWKLDIKSNRLEKFADGADGQKFKIPNFPVFDKYGRLFISESGAFREVRGKIYCFNPDGSGGIWHDGPFNFANGMALSAAGDYLYVVCTWLPGVERIAINADGTAGNREVFATLPKTCPDGIAFDIEESLYVSCYAPNAIFKISKNQEAWLLIDDWEGHALSNPTNIAFGGENFGCLFVSNLGRWHISKIEMPVSGLKLACHK